MEVITKNLKLYQNLILWMYKCSKFRRDLLIGQNWHHLSISLPQIILMTRFFSGQTKQSGWATTAGIDPPRQEYCQRHNYDHNIKHDQLKRHCSHSHHILSYFPCPSFSKLKPTFKIKSRLPWEARSYISVRVHQCQLGRWWQIFFGGVNYYFWES